MNLMKKKFGVVIFILSIIVICFNECSILGACVEAEGEVVTTEVKLDKFSKIELKGASKVTLHQGEIQNVTITATQNIIDLLNRDVKSDEWEIKFNRCLESVEDISIDITIPDIEELSVEGSGSIIGDGLISSNLLELSVDGSGELNLNLDVKELESEINGSGDLKLKGTTKTHDIEINGSGDVEAYELTADEATIEINGSGDVKLDVSYSLDVEVNGSGDVYYRGNVKKIDSDISGSGKLKQAE